MAAPPEFRRPAPLRFRSIPVERETCPECGHTETLKEARARVAEWERWENTRPPTDPLDYQIGRALSESVRKSIRRSLDFWSGDGPRTYSFGPPPGDD